MNEDTQYLLKGIKARLERGWERGVIGPVVYDRVQRAVGKILLDAPEHNDIDDTNILLAQVSHNLGAEYPACCL